MVPLNYLREGNTPEKRDGMRSFLRAQGYRNAYVSPDTSDWRLNEKLVETLRNNPKAADAELAPVKAAYLAHVRQRALAYRVLSWKQQGLCPPGCPAARPRQPAERSVSFTISPAFHRRMRGPQLPAPRLITSDMSPTLCWPTMRGKRCCTR
ncbi:MAG: peptidoglycan-N-acetylglucosamine deacetylase [Massilia sp.]